MTRKLFKLFAIAAALLTGSPAIASPARIPPSWDTWSVDCGNSGICFASTFVRGQATWVDVRVVRDWQANADPLLRITTNTPLADDGEIRLSVDGQLEDTLPIAHLREIQASVTSPSGFRPIGGEGFWYPTGQATRALLEKISKGAVLTIELPIAPEKTQVDVALSGLKPALSWIDERQTRNGTTSAIINPGTEESIDAPHADPVTSPDELPPAVRTVWGTSRSCADIDPAIFASLDAVAMPLGDTSVLYILPCGAPGAYNAPYTAILAAPDGSVTRLYVARMSEHGPVATDIIYNARWYPAELKLESLFKGSGLGECGIWNQWNWTGAGFALTEEAARQGCDGKETPITEWPSTWTNPALAR